MVDGTEAIALLDKWLQLTTERSMFSADEIQDFMLDLRFSLTPTPEPELVTA